jgi:hypothetical protein
MLSSQHTERFVHYSSSSLARALFEVVACSVSESPGTRDRLTGAAPAARELSRCDPRRRIRGLRAGIRVVVPEVRLPARTGRNGNGDLRARKQHPLSTVRPPRRPHIVEPLTDGAAGGGSDRVLRRRPRCGDRLRGGSSCDQRGRGDGESALPVSCRCFHCCTPGRVDDCQSTVGAATPGGIGRVPMRSLGIALDSLREESV